MSVYQEPHIVSPIVEDDDSSDTTLRPSPLQYPQRSRPRESQRMSSQRTALSPPPRLERFTSLRVGNFQRVPSTASSRTADDYFDPQPFNQDSQRPSEVGTQSQPPTPPSTLTRFKSLRAVRPQLARSSSKSFWQSRELTEKELEDRTYARQAVRREAINPAVQAVDFDLVSSLTKISRHDSKRFKLQPLPAGAVDHDAALVSDSSSEKTLVNRSDDRQVPRINKTRYVGIMCALCVTFSLLALDATIVATLLPTITGQWNSISEVGWYGAAYLLPQPTLQPLFGKLYPFFDAKILFVLSLAIFEIGSLVCALANSSTMFIVGRLVAGVGAAALAPGIFALITELVPRSKRPIFTGLGASTAGIAAVLGPVLGGVLTQQLSWRWCFYINLPLGAAVVTIIIICCPPLGCRMKMPVLYELFLALDPIGVKLLTASVVCLLFAMQFGAQDSWSAPGVIALLTVSGVLIVWFGFQQAMADPLQALLPRSLFVEGTDAQGSGVKLIPYLLSQTTAAIATGIFVQRSRLFNPPMLLGTAVFAVGAGFLYTLDADTPNARIIGFQILTGFGAGCGQFLATGIAQQVLSREEESIGLSMVYMIKMLGATISVAICSTLFNGELKSNLSNGGFDQAQVEQIEAAIATSSKFNGTSGDATESIIKDAITQSVTTTFIVPIAVGVLAFVVAVVQPWQKVALPEKEEGSGQEKPVVK
ncbi:putative HC-toxin efflux carrier TOXA [Cyphellophora attinorum]|uniref:Putative HC-toxin efflux carrier TOXA n=1 Tax=Cyphellophora attinorum TaxID=1664694 RepID=A0A0N1H5G6_9EURO|nr:putative HC-toxin efflux carrier TOXA [Phialophora attinorum]KPI36246.1 putative HC-toxin efflux carrier TOXA [Phialophora attinorum]